jgi:hypothetical protein
MTTIEFPIPANLRLPPVDSGLSEDANRLRAMLRFVASPGTSIALGDPEQRLEVILEESALEDWDGYGARRVSQETAEVARRFLFALPFSATHVDIQADPQGEILFEWCVSPDWILTVAIDQNGRLAYSGLFGRGRIRGTEFFESALPPSIAVALARLVERKTMVAAGSW